MSRRRPHRPTLIPPGRRPVAAVDYAQLLLAAEGLQRTGNLQAALKGYYRVMLALGKTSPIAHRAMFLTALACFQLRIYDEAILLMEEVRRLQWANADVHYNLGLFYQASGRVGDAVDCYRTCLALRPEYAAAENNLGNALRELGDHETAQLCFDRLIARDPRDPEARYNLAHILLLRGHLARGFDCYEARWSCASWNAEYGRRDITSPRLAADARPQDVLVFQEQGIGDTLQFMRYLPSLLARGHRLFFEAPQELWPWIRGIERPGLTCLRRGDPLPPHDAHLPLMSLAAYCGIADEATIPPPLALPVRVRSPLADDPDPRPLIAFAWAGNPRHHNDRHRSAPLEQLAPLFARPDTRFVSVQVGARGTELFAALPSLPLGPGSEILDCSASLRDFEHTAALLQQCRAVVTVDTSVAHLAATLGVRTLLLTSWLSEWRWQLDRTDSPWYPAVELVRQPSLGDWPAVAARARELLEAS